MDMQKYVWMDKDGYGEIYGHAWINVNRNGGMHVDMDGHGWTSANKKTQRPLGP